MDIKIWDLDEDGEKTSMKTMFPDEIVIDDSLKGIRKVDTSGLSGYCEEIEVFNLEEDKEYAEKHEDKYAVAFTVGFGPIENGLTEDFYDKAENIFRKRIDVLLRLFNLSSWRVGLGILDRDREDVVIVQGGADYPSWIIYFPLTSQMTYKRVIEMAKTLESYMKELKEAIDNSLK